MATPLTPHPTPCMQHVERHKQNLARPGTITGDRMPIQGNPACLDCCRISGVGPPACQHRWQQCQTLEYGEVRANIPPLLLLLLPPNLCSCRQLLPGHD